METKLVFVSEIYSDNLVSVDYKRKHESWFKTFKLSDAQVSAFNSAENVHAKLSIVYQAQLIDEEVVD